VIGVLPPAFRFLSSDARLFLPLPSRPEDRAPLQRHSGGNVTQMIARLKPGATVAQGQSQIDAQNAALEVDDPQAKMIADAGFRSIVVSLHADHKSWPKRRAWSKILHTQGWAPGKRFGDFHGKGNFPSIPVVLSVDWRRYDNSTKPFL
jgi:hypothetical protein